MSTVLQVEHLVQRETQILTILPQQNVDDAARIMTERSVGCLLVVDERQKILGIITERDIISKVIGLSLSPRETLVESAMTRKVIACSMDTSLARAQQIMADHGIRHLPILEDGRPVAMISSRDVLAHQLATVQAVARRQSKLLRDLETQHPGISHIVTDEAGRVVI